MKKRFLVLLGLPLLVLFLSSFISAVGDLSVNSALIKVSLKEGGTFSKQIEFSSSLGGEIFMDSGNIKGVSVPRPSFLLSPNQRVRADLLFDSSGVSPGIYVGDISLKSSSEEKNILTIFEVESQDLFFDANLDIPPVYSKISPGKNVLAQIKIFDLNSGGTQLGTSPTSVNVQYYVYNSFGEVIASISETMVVDKSASVSKSIPLSESTLPGEYIIAVVVKYKNSVGVSSGVFAVSYSEKSNLFNLDNGLGIYIILALLIVFVLGMFFFFLLIKDRDKLLLELKKYNDSELKNQKEFLKEQMSLLVKKGEMSKSEVKKEISSKINKLREKHVERIKIIKKLKDDGQINSMKKKMNEWKAKGYNTLLLESKLNGLDSSDMKKIMSNWKKRGYKL